MRSLDLKIIKAEKKYFRFIKAQEVLAEPFRDKSSQFKNFYLPISDLIFKNYIKDKKTKIIGLTGGQGSGKSTISNILKIILKEIYKLETVIFSIDDFYKTSAFVSAIEKRQGLKISCPEEIAWRMGFIDDDKLNFLSKNLLNSGYGDYLQSLIKEKENL